MVCGGDYYDREVYSPVETPSYTSFTSTTKKKKKKPKDYSEKADSLLRSNTTMHKSWNPHRWKDEKLVCDAENPIVLILDVTGSMGDWPKIIYDKLPMFYGQLMVQKYLDDPSLGFCCVSDAYSRPETIPPLQISEFGRGREIDQILSKMHIAGGGGGNRFETYEIGGYFYLHRFEMPKKKAPFIFVCGDDNYRKTIHEDKLMMTMGVGIEGTEKYIEARGMWMDLMKKFDGNLFYLNARERFTDGRRKTNWRTTMPEGHNIPVIKPKAFVDIILGVIAIVNQRRTFDEYIQDLVEKGQTKERIDEVSNALKKLWEVVKKKTGGVTRKQGEGGGFVDLGEDEGEEEED